MVAEPRPVAPLTLPPDATVRVPGSKSFTNRALLAAAVAPGRSTLRGGLVADDSEAMVDCLRRLGAQIAVGDGAGGIATVTIDGCGGALPSGDLTLAARLSGTTSRFVLPLLACGPGRYRLDGAEPLRRRPMGPTLDALVALGASVTTLGAPGHLPVTVAGGPVRGGTVVVPGDASSQFLSGLLLAGPAMPDGLRVELGTPLVSRPYVDMTVAVMATFGADVDVPDEDTFVVRPGLYAPADYRLEPDASAACYLLAAAAITGGRVRVEGLGSESIQGDLHFADVLAAMGADVTIDGASVEVRGTGHLDGGTFDLTAMPDQAQTLAAMAVFASGPTRVRGIGFIRGHETDRIAAVVAELRKLGIEATEDDDGFTVHPGTPRPGVVDTYHDHRMAMSFALIGLRAPGIAIADPACVAKTYPGFFDSLDQLRRPGSGG